VQVKKETMRSGVGRLNATYAGLPTPRLDWEEMPAGPVPRLIGASVQIVVYELSHSLSLSAHARKKKNSETKVFVPCSTERLFCFLFPLFKITSKRA
jgi:hypothetical protein